MTGQSGSYPRSGHNSPYLQDGAEIGSYRIESFIAHGGMAFVYEATDTRLARHVALKLLAPELAQEKDFRERFMRESRFAAAIDHPNIVPIYEAGEIDGLLFIAMRFVPGDNLDSHLQQVGRLGPDRALTVLTPIADALDAAHAAGLVHRDVKPANILLAAGGREGREHVYLTDFGITKRTSGLTKLTATGNVIGTMAYTAPEQILGGQLDARTDLYAFGCVAYQCLTGVAPFVRDNQGALVWAHLNEQPAPVSSHLPELRPVDVVIGRALEKDPQERYATCEEFTDALRAALAHAQHVAAPTVTAGIDHRPPPVTGSGSTGSGSTGSGSTGTGFGPTGSGSTGPGSTGSGLGSTGAGSIGSGSGSTGSRTRSTVGQPPPPAPRTSQTARTGQSPPTGPGTTGPGTTGPRTTGRGTTAPGTTGTTRTRHRMPPRPKRRAHLAVVTVVVAVVALLLVVVIPLGHGTLEAGTAQRPATGATADTEAAMASDPPSTGGSTDMSMAPTGHDHDMAGMDPAGDPAPETSLVAQPSVAPTTNPAPGTAPTAEAVAPAAAIPSVDGQPINVGATPGSVTITPNGRFAYVANRTAGTVTVVDTNVNKVSATIPITAGPPRYIAFTPDGSRAYVSTYTDDMTVNRVAVLDTRTTKELRTIEVDSGPYALAVTPDQKYVYVPSHDAAKIDVIDTTTDTVVQQVAVPINPHSVTFSADGKLAYVADHQANVVSILDLSNNMVLKTIPVGTSPHSVALSPDGTQLAVVCYDSSDIYFIDTASQQVVGTAPVGNHPQDVTYSADGSYLYTANVDANTVSVLDTASRTVTATIPTNSPTSIAVRPDGQKAYVTNLDDGTLTVLNTSG